jgi:hypothetical protein
MCPGSKGGRCVELTTLPPPCADLLEILGAPHFWSPKGFSRPLYGWLYLLLAQYYVFWEPHTSGTPRDSPGLYMDGFICCLHSITYSGSPTLLEPQGILQASIGMALSVACTVLRSLGAPHFWSPTLLEPQEFSRPL